MLLPNASSQKQQQQQQQQQRQRQHGQGRMDQIREIAASLIVHRRDVSLKQYGEPHDCQRKLCGPYTCELDIFKQSHPRNPCVYVCRMGKIHVCTADECTHYVGTHEGTCPLTGLYHGHTRGDTGYIPQEKRTWRIKRGDSAAIPIADQNEAGFATPPPLVLEFRVKKESQPLQDGATFDPFTILERRDKDQKRPSLAEEKPASVGATSGAAASGVTAAPAPAEKSGRRGKKRKLNKDLIQMESERERLCGIAEDIVEALLFSDTRRQFNEKKQRILKQQCSQALDRYYEAHKMSFPIAIEMMEIMAMYENNIFYLAILPRDNSIIRYYVQVALATWSVVVNSPWAVENPGASFEHHAMSILYVLRDGLVVENFPVIQRDEFMRHLPNRNDLPCFGARFSPAVVTAGLKHIRNAYISAATKGGQSLDAITLRVETPVIRE